MGEDGLRALLIEDSPSDALLLRELVAWSRVRIKLLHAERLAEGLEMLRRGSVEVVLLDLSLPDARGLETVVRTHAAAPNVAIVVLTGLDDEATALQAMQQGAQDYLVKGRVDGDSLVRAIRYARERMRAEEAMHHLIREQAARASAETAERRARFLAEASRALSSSLDYETTLSTVVKLSIPAIADCCLMDLLQENGRCRRSGAIAARGSPPELWREEPRDVLALLDDPVSQVLHTGEMVVLGELTEPVCRALRLPERWGQERPAAVISVPLIARNRILGAMTFVTWDPDRLRGQESFAADLGHRVALAVDNARLYRAREQILEVVSHDLRTPLTAMIGNLALINDAQVPPPRALELIARSAQHMSRLIEDLLDMSRMEGGTFVLDRSPLSVAQLVDEVVRMMLPSAESRGVQLRAEGGTGEALTVHADRRRILQVLWNLVGNGIKFTPAGGTVRLSATAERNEVRVEVADNGPGIAERDLPRVFERRWQGNIADLRGAGLGLSIAKAIVEAHGGTIGVSSSASGTSFYFTLPRVTPHVSI